MIRRLLAVAAIAAGIAAAPGAAQAQAPPAADDALWGALRANRMTPPGEAPPFALRDLAGEVVPLEQFRGQLVLAYFWTTW